MATRVSSPILIGREAELRTLIVARDAAAAGRPSTVLIGGEAGIGKSRLVAELTRHAWANHAHLASGRSPAGGAGHSTFSRAAAEVMTALDPSVLPARHWPISTSTGCSTWSR